MIGCGRAIDRHIIAPITRKSVGISPPSISEPGAVPLRQWLPCTVWPPESEREFKRKVNQACGRLLAG